MGTVGDLCHPVRILIDVTLMVMWSSNLAPIKPTYQFLDLFAGVANATKIWCLGCIPFEMISSIRAGIHASIFNNPRSGKHYVCAKVDSTYTPNQRTMDFLTPPGFLFPGTCWNRAYMFFDRLSV